MIVLVAWYAFAAAILIVAAAVVVFLVRLLAQEFEDRRERRNGYRPIVEYVDAEFFEDEPFLRPVTEFQAPIAVRYMQPAVVAVEARHASDEQSTRRDHKPRHSKVQRALEAALSRPTELFDARMLWEGVLVEEHGPREVDIPDEQRAIVRREGNPAAKWAQHYVPTLAGMRGRPPVFEDVTGQLALFDADVT